MTVKTCTREVSAFDRDVETFADLGDIIILSTTSSRDEFQSWDESYVTVTYVETLAEACKVWGIEFHPAQ